MTTRTRLPAAYWRLWAASTGSNLGDGVVLAALPLLAAQLTRDPVAVSMVTVAAFLPWLIFGIPAGVVVDRIDRRTLLWVGDVFRGAVVLGLGAAVAFDVVGLPMIYLTVLLLGIGETVFDTAAQTILPAVVSSEHLETANGRLFGAQLTANGFAGPPLGGWLFAAAAALPFFFDAATFALSAALILTVRGSFRPVSEVSRGVFADVGEGMTWLWRHRVIRAFALGAAAINIGYAGASAVLVLYAQDLLGLGDVGYGLLLAGAAVGAVAGTVLAAPVVRRLGRGRAVLAAVGVLAASITLAGVAPVAVICAAALAVFGLAGEVWNVVAVSYRQAAVPDRLLGRVMAGYRFIAYGAFPVGAALGGVIAGRFGLRAPFLVAGVVMAALLLCLTPVLRGEDLDHPTLG